MKNVRVPLFGNPGKSATIDAEATNGATVGTNLFNADGSLVTASQLSGGSSSPPTSIDLGTSDDLDEGSFNLYFTAKRAQDAVGSILTDTATIDFSYDDVAHTITADLKDLASSVSGSLVGITRDSKGRVSGTKPVNAGDGIAITDSGTAIAISLVGLPIYIVSQDGDQVTDQSGDPIISSQSTSLPVDWTDVQNKPTTVAGYGITDAQIIGDPVKNPEFLLASLPDPLVNKGCTIMVIDMTEGYRPAWSDGTNWRRFSDNTIAS